MKDEGLRSLQTQEDRAHSAQLGAAGALPSHRRSGSFSPASCWSPGPCRLAADPDRHGCCKVTWTTAAQRPHPRTSAGTHIMAPEAVRAEPRASASPLPPSPTSHRPLNTYLVCPVLQHVSVCPPRGLLETQGHGRCPRPHTSGPRPAGQQYVRGGFVEFRVGSGGSCRSPGRHRGSRCGLPNLARLTPPLAPGSVCPLRPARGLVTQPAPHADWDLLSRLLSCLSTHTAHTGA